MRITENSARSLVLNEQTVWISVVCVLAAMVMVYQSWASHRWGGLVSAGFFALFALLSLRTARAEFDKHARVATLDKLRVFKRSSLRLPFDEISDVVIETDTLGEGSAPSCRLSLQTKDGSQLLTDSYSSSYGNYIVMRFAILETLGRPVSDAVDQSLRELIRSRRTIDAIALLRSQKNMDLTTARERVAELRRELEGKDPAAYTDTVTLLLCSDPQCKVVIANAPLSVTYTVTTPTGSSAPTVTLDSTSQSYSALYVEQAIMSATPDPNALTFTNFSTTPYVQVSAPTTDGIIGTTFLMSDATHGGIEFAFAAAGSLKQGTYTTPVSITVCFDTACVNPVAGGSFTLMVNYVVTNTLTVGGTNGYKIAAFPLAAHLIAANAQQSTIYAVVLPSGTTTTISLQGIDATTGQSSLAPLVLASNPNTPMALSDDGQYLYLNQSSFVEQVVTSTLTAGLTIPANGGASANASIAVEPGHSQTIAVSGGGLLEIFDGTVARPNTLTPSVFFYSDLAWTSNPSLLAAYAAGATVENECGLALDSNGFFGSQTPTCVSAFYGGPANVNRNFKFANGFGYGSGGAVLNDSTWTYVATLSAPNEQIDQVVPDATLGTAFAIAQDVGYTSCHLMSFSLSSNNLVGSLRLPNTNSDTSGTCGLIQLVRWGTNGLALVGPNDLVVISGAFVSP